MTEKIAQNKKGKAAKEKELGAGGKYQKDEEVALPGSAQKQGEADSIQGNDSFSSLM